METFKPMGGKRETVEGKDHGAGSTGQRAERGERGARTAYPETKNEEREERRVESEQRGTMKRVGSAGCAKRLNPPRATGRSDAGVYISEGMFQFV